MKRIWKALSLLLVLALTLIPVVPATAESSPVDKKDLSGYTVILHTNDTHGRAVQDSYNAAMGFTAVSALKKEYEKAGAEVILLDAGDTLHGLPFATLEKGAGIVELMNLVGYDAMSPGNHDFNYGTSTLTGLALTMKFPLLSANITKKDDGSSLFKENIIIEKNGVKYGIFGLSTTETAFKTNPKNVETINFGEPIEPAKKQVAALKEKGADVIIALSHLGNDESSLYTSELLAKKVDGIDLIVDGHSHSVYESGYIVGDSLIVSTGEYFKNIGVVTIDPKGNKTAKLVNLDSYAATDVDIDALVKNRTTAQDKLLSEVVGHTSVYLDGVRENVRTKETNLGNLTTDAMRKVTGADVAFTNGGGIRASIEIGDITKKHLVTVFPFGNYVVTKNITGETLLQVLEVGVASYPETLGAFPQVSGITFTIDASKPAGNRVSNAKINGTAIDPKAEYLLATNDFIVAGGDGYTMLADYPVENEYGSLEEILINYIKEFKTIDIQSEKRITVINEVVKEDKADVPETIKSEKMVEPKTTEIKPVEQKATEPKPTDSIKKVEPQLEVKSEKEESPQNTDTYIVAKGDYLWKIAETLYNDGSKWKMIYDWNKDTISNPNELQVGQELIIFAD